jgi:hypothetical protein
MLGWQSFGDASNRQDIILVHAIAIQNSQFSICITRPALQSPRCCDALAKRSYIKHDREKADKKRLLRKDSKEKAVKKHSWKKTLNKRLPTDAMLLMQNQRVPI